MNNYVWLITEIADGNQRRSNTHFSSQYLLLIHDVGIAEKKVHIFDLFAFAWWYTFLASSSNANAYKVFELDQHIERKNTSL